MTPSQTARKRHRSDVGDDERAFAAPYLTLMPEDAPHREHPLREVFTTGWAGSCGPGAVVAAAERPAPWPAVYQQTRCWIAAGVFEAMVHDLRRLLREAQGHAPQPRAAIPDSRALQSSPESGDRAGYDGAKKVSGRKRHLLVETQGLVLRAKVHTAALQDRAAVPLLLDGAAEQFPRLGHVWVDQGYTGAGRAWMEHELGRSVEVVQHPRTWERGSRRHGPVGAGWLPPRVQHRPRQGGVPGVLPRRWAVERTFSWLGHSRRLSKEYEHLCETSEVLIYATMTRLMARRLARI